MYVRFGCGVDTYTYDILIFYFDLRSVRFSSVSLAPFDSMGGFGHPGRNLYLLT